MPPASCSCAAKNAAHQNEPRSERQASARGGTCRGAAQRRETLDDVAEVEREYLKPLAL